VAVVSLVVMVSSDCAARRGPTVEAFGRQLLVDVTLDQDEAEIGETLGARYRLRNLGKATIEACIGDAGGYTVIGSEDARGLVDVVNHPSCATHFSLRAGEELTGLRPVTIPEVGQGSSKVVLWIQVVDPTRCDRYGCDAILLKSPAGAPLTIRGRRSDGRLAAPRLQTKQAPRRFLPRVARDVASSR